MISEKMKEKFWSGRQQNLHELTFASS